MDSLTNRIAALPEWPEDLTGYPPPDDAEWNDYLHAKIGCALARLALAREIIRTRALIQSDADYDEVSALLAALEGPK